MLMWVEMNMVTTARMGKISRGRLSAARLYWGTRVRSMPKKSMWLPNSVMVLSWSAVNTEVTLLSPASTCSMMLVSRVTCVKLMPRASMALPAALMASAPMWKMRCSGRYTTSMTPNMTRKLTSIGIQPAVGL